MSLSLNSNLARVEAPEIPTIHQQLTAVLTGALLERGDDLRTWPEDEATVFRHFGWDGGNEAVRELRMRKAATAALTLIKANGMPGQPDSEKLQATLSSAASEFFNPTPRPDSMPESQWDALESKRHQRLADILHPHATH